MSSDKTTEEYKKEFAKMHKYICGSKKWSDMKSEYDSVNKEIYDIISGGLDKSTNELIALNPDVKTIPRSVDESHESFKLPKEAETIDKLLDFFNLSNKQEAETTNNIIQLLEKRKKILSEMEDYLKSNLEDVLDAL